MTSLRDRHVVITGGSKGIGAAAAHSAAGRAARVSLIARGEAELRATATEIGPEVSWQVGDVTDESGTRALQALELRVGPCDVLVCCAGVALPGRFVDVPLAEFDQQWAANVRPASPRRTCVSHPKRRQSPDASNLWPPRRWPRRWSEGSSVTSAT